MSKDIKNLIIESLKDQQEIFGDYLFEKLSPKRKVVIQQSTIKNEPVQEKPAEDIPVEKEEIILAKTESKTTEAFLSCKTLDELNEIINTCTKCSLGETRNKFVFGVGNPNADVMLVGEAPGAEEDKQGEPFVGRAGKLLTDILKAINFEREEVFIANILKCRPPNNRDPLPEEMNVCRPYLDKQMELIKPKMILCLGRIAATSLLNKNETLGKLRQEVHDLNGIKVMATYHPAALLRNPNWKRGCWDDVQKFRKLYDELTGN